MQLFTKIIPISFRAIAEGDGFWDMKKGTIVIFKECLIKVFVDVTAERGHQFWSEVQLTHNMDATRAGLCYSDSGIRYTVRKELARYEEIASIVNASDASGSEQDMQGQFMYSLDADVMNTIKVTELLESGFVASASL